jgi:hypothetical protein
LLVEKGSSLMVLSTLIVDNGRLKNRQQTELKTYHDPPHFSPGGGSELDQEAGKQYLMVST